MTCTHALFNLPAGFVGIAFYHVISSPAELGKYIAPIFNIYMCSMVIASVGSLADAIIYFFLFPAFRRTARQVLCFRRAEIVSHVRRHSSHPSMRTGDQESSSSRPPQQLNPIINISLDIRSFGELHMPPLNWGLENSSRVQHSPNDPFQIISRPNNI